jgi:hypothetical protein
VLIDDEVLDVSVANVGTVCIHNASPLQPNVAKVEGTPQDFEGWLIWLFVMGMRMKDE